MAPRIESLDRPLLVLAGFAVLLYLAELFRFFPVEAKAWLFWTGLVIDLTFAVDLVAKIVFRGRPYLKTPWFLVDLVSTLPLLSSLVELIGVAVFQLQALSAVRMVRIARLSQAVRFMGMIRVARALRIARGLAFLKRAPPALQETPAFNRALFVGVPLVLLGFVVASYTIQSMEISRIEARLQERLDRTGSPAEVLRWADVLTGRDADNPLIPKITLRRTFPDGERTFVISLERGLRNADKQQGFVLLLVLVSVLASVFIVGSLAADQRKNQEIEILGNCFSPAVVKKFVEAPESLERYYSRWMSVLFIDVCGFTATTERLGTDIEGLATRLRRVMDIARDEIVVTHEGVVDKFIGDAAMGWLGGQFSRHWSLVADLRRQLLFDEIEIVRMDLQTLRRVDATSSAEAPSPEIARLESALAALERQQAGMLERSPETRRAWEAATDGHRRAVARSAVLCLLRISERVRAQPQGDAFREVKIGLASGEVCVGNFGSSHQIGFTIVGRTVNRAARFEPASAQCGVRILCDHDTYELVEGADDVTFRRWGTVAVKGIEDGMSCYEPISATDENRRWVAAFHVALAKVESGGLRDALALFETASAARPGGDPASEVWIGRIRDALAAGETRIGPFHASK
ncbi:MAG: adenylate/guanylate cyclase domain-containing protein [Candidatus Riflebacteria bacterium]|nr:adenylate/guanylate cyclase domain-containing protein [Candidatus Riflebacteria bacterium]